MLRQDEIDALWRVCSSQRDRAMVALLLDTGIRLGELAGLRWQDIDEDALRVDGKTGPRILPLSPQVRAMLNGLGDSVHIWISQHGRPMPQASIQGVIRARFGRSGLKGPKLGPHILRHTFPTHYVKNGGNLVCLQQKIGHASITTTERYLHLSSMMTKMDHQAHSPVGRMLGGLAVDQ